MGSPISPILANLQMENLETKILASLNFQPLFYYRYVDDIITAIPNNRINVFLDAFNAADSKIKFTIETEINGQIPFLDLLLIHNINGSISFDWFKKDTCSNRYLNFHSWLPFSYKTNTIKILTNKILKLSDKKFHFQNLNFLRNILICNNYPIKFINNIIHKEIHKVTHNLSPSTNINILQNNNQKYFLSIPYIKDLFEKIKQLFKIHNVQIIGRSSINLNDLFFSKTKDTVPFNKQSNIIYEVKCTCNATYVGQTKQFLEKRIYQHKSQINSNNPCSALTKHLSESKHVISLDNVKILDKEQDFRKRSILEMLFIKSNNDRLNIQEDVTYIGNYYDYFLL